MIIMSVKLGFESIEVNVVPKQVRCLNTIFHNRGRRCGVRVPTRWRLSSLLLYNYCMDSRLQNCVVGCVLSEIGDDLCGGGVMSDACHAEGEYPQDDGCGKKGDDMYSLSCV